MENSTHEHQWYYIFVSWKNGKQPSQIHKELEVAGGSKALSLRTIYWWIEAFEEDENSIEDVSCHEAVTQGTIGKMEELINEDSHMPIRRIEEEVGISKERIGHILHNEHRRTVRHLMLHHDNAAPHKSKIVDDYLSENKVRILSPL